MVKPYKKNSKNLPALFENSISKIDYQKLSSKVIVLSERNFETFKNINFYYKMTEIIKIAG